MCGIGIEMWSACERASAEYSTWHSRRDKKYPEKKGLRKLANESTNGVWQRAQRERNDKILIDLHRIKSAIAAAAVALYNFVRLSYMCDIDVDVDVCIQPCFPLSRNAPMSIAMKFTYTQSNVNNAIALH